MKTAIKPRQNREELLGSAPMLPLLLKMSLPAVAAQLVNLLYSIVDSIYIGHIPVIGTDALAGIGVTSSLIILISAFAQFVSGGGAPLASIALGEGNRERAAMILGNGFVLLIVFAVVTSSVSYIFMEPILYLIGAAEDTIGYAADYLSIYLIGTVFVLMSTGLNTFINTQGRPAIAMLSVLIGAVLNIVLDPLFIFTLGMNVKGAALATVISQAASAAFVLGFLFSKKATLRIEPRYMKPDKKIIGSIFSLGISPFVMASTESFVGFVLNGSLMRYGGKIYVSALTIMQRAMQMISVPLAGISAGYIPIVSYNYGSKNPSRVKEAFKVALYIKFFFNLIACLFIILFPAFVASLFTEDPVLIETVRKYTPIFFAGMTIFGLQRTCQNTFVALGQAKVSLFIALLRKVILLIPLALVLPILLGGNVGGVYLAEAIADGTAAILCTLIFACTFPKILRKIAG